MIFFVLYDFRKGRFLLDLCEKLAETIKLYKIFGREKWKKKKCKKCIDIA